MTGGGVQVGESGVVKLSRLEAGESLGKEEDTRGERPCEEREGRTRNLESTLGPVGVREIP